VFATFIPKQQLIAHLDNETMLAGDPRIINHNVIVGSTAYKSDISILESLLSHGEVLVFQFKSIHGAPHDLMTWCNLIQLQSLCLLLW
jgi:azurin